MWSNVGTRIISISLDRSLPLRCRAHQKLTQLINGVKPSDTGPHSTGSPISYPLFANLTNTGKVDCKPLSLAVAGVVRPCIHNQMSPKKRELSGAILKRKAPIVKVEKKEKQQKTSKSKTSSIAKAKLSGAIVKYKAQRQQFENKNQTHQGGGGRTGSN